MITIWYSADDTSIIITDTNQRDFNINANQTFQDINTWFKVNLLTLNLNKTQFLEFRTKNYYNVDTQINPLMPNDHYSGRTAPLTSKHCIIYNYSTNIGTEYFKHGIYSPFLSLQNAVCFIILTYLVPVLFTFLYSVC